ncbi:recombinase family protein [Streptomyces sp. NPDC056707]|uniref:recombinase family protein n=1 Tax=Streptomyces sp. NPDC056707 TaxID=3345919 RepID=UPI0036B5A063
MTLRAAIYCRISDDREGAGLGIARQREDCEALAAAQGWDVTAVYDDNDLSAYSGKPRPGYQALLDALRAGTVDIVIAWHTDRLHRRPTELEEYIDLCEPRKVQTRTVTAGQLDLSTASGRMMARQLGVHARYEVEHNIERIQRGKQQAAAQGKWLGGVRPFGYEADGMTIRESEAQEIRNATGLILAGASLRSLTKDWNDRGIVTSRNGKWEATELGRLLTRPRNAGLIKYQGEEMGPAMWDAIVEEPTWRAAVQVLKDPARRTTTTNARKWLGSGLYLCGMCPETMRVSTSGTTAGRVHVPAYRCRTGKHVTRQAEVLDAYVSEVVVARLVRPDAVELLRAPESEGVDVEQLQTTLLAARSRLDEIAALFGSGVFDAKQTREASEAARRQMRVAEAALVEVAQVNPLVGVVGVPDVRGVWEELDLSRKRAVMDCLLQVVVLPARRGRLPAGMRLDTEAVEFRWR